MKKYNLAASAIMVIACTLWITSCQDDSNEFGSISPASQTTLQGASGFEKGALIGTVKSNKELTKDWWKYVMSIDCEHNPLYNDPASPTATGQNGPVKFLAAPKDGFSTSNVIAGRTQTLVVPLVNALGYLSCDEPVFYPTAAQTLEQYLRTRTGKFIDGIGGIKAILDGKQIFISKSNRITSDLFYFQSNQDLVDCVEPCVTGGPQAAVSDGYWLFLKGLAKGNHTLHIRFDVSPTDPTDITYHIAVP